MNPRLLDTNIVSYMHKRNRFLKLYRHHVEGYELAIAFQTVAELYEGGLKAEWGSDQWSDLHESIEPMWVIHSDDEIILRWAEIKNLRRSRPIGDADCWIAATAWAYGLELVTHNPKDFAGIPGLIIISEAP